MEAKITLTVVLPGRTMVSSVEAEKNPQECLNSSFITLSRFSKKQKKVLRKTYEIKTRTYIPAKQVINMTKEAYKSMITECPEWCTIKEWGRLNKIQRLEKNLRRICESLGGTSYSYELFED